MGRKWSLKSLFFEETDSEIDTTQETPAAKRTQKTDTQRLPKTEPQTHGVTQATIVRTNGKEDKAVKESLIKALENANQEGYDYFEFARAVEQQKNFVDSEQIRFQTTHAAASVMGVTPSKLIESAQYYLNILAQKEKEFQAAFNQNKQSEITTKKGAIEEIDRDLTSKAEQINAITKQIGLLQEQKTKLEKEIEANKQKIESVQKNFYSTYQLFIERINSDINKIKKYLLHS